MAYSSDLDPCTLAFCISEMDIFFAFMWGRKTAPESFKNQNFFFALPYLSLVCRENPLFFLILPNLLDVLPGNGGLHLREQ